MTLPFWIIGLPFAASLLICGMPHGAADGALIHRAAKRLTSAAPARITAGAVFLYTLAIAAAAAAFAAAPAPYLAAFLLVAVLHFAAAATRLERLRPHPPRFPEALAVSAAVVLLPFALQPDAAADVFSRAAALAGGPAFPRPFVAAAGALGALGALAAAALAARRRDGIALARAAAVVISHALLHPLLAVGLWFFLWHALPETLRVGRELARRDDLFPPAAFLRTHAASLPLLVPTLLAIAAALLALGVPTTIQSLAIAAIAAYAVVTPPHALLQELLARPHLLRRPPAPTSLTPPATGRAPQASDRRAGCSRTTSIRPG